MRRTTITLAAVALLCGAFTVSGAAGTPEPDDTGGVPLLTGDRVLVGPGGKVTPVAGEGRDGIGFTIQQDGGHTYVIPADAVRLVADGTLDRQLFDVAMLDREGYDDRDTVPLIVQGGTNLKAAQRSLPAIGGSAVRVPREDSTFWRSVTHSRGIRRIWLDARVHLQLDQSVPQIGAPAAWAAGYTGAGVKVAVLDSGVDATHPDLAGKIAVRRNFTPESDTDLVGHGTHVAATIASNDKKYRGVAPGASLIIGKVITKDGGGDISWLLDAMEWASTEEHAKVVNLSLGGQDSPGVDPIEEAVDRLTAQNGTLFVAGAGNNGMGGSGTVASPSTADAALSVGAVDRTDTLAPFSSRGPRVGDHALKPDITAPGVGIVAATSKDGYLGYPGQTHVAGSGTSMSCPHAAGAAALLFDEHPDWTPAQVKAALMGSAKPAADVSTFDQGAGRVDLSTAITQTVLAEQPSLSFGEAQWPHDDDTPVTRTLTYRNLSASDVTLTLTGPPRVFRLSATSLTVPAGGTASVDVTADTRGDLPDGAHTGYVVATGGPTVVRTPVGVTREVESYDVTVRALDRDGAPTSHFLVQLGGYAGPVNAEPTFDEDGTAHLRVPRGRYVLAVDVRTGADEQGLDDLVVTPRFEVTGNRAVTVDARVAKPVTPSVERAGAAMATAATGFVTLPEGGGFTGSWVDDPKGRLRTAQLGPDGPADQFFGAQQAVFAAPGADGGFDESPYVYNLAWVTPGKVLTGARKVRDADLARVRTSNLGRGTALKGSIAASAVNPLVSFPGTMLLRMTLPFTREELFTTEGVTWTTPFLLNPNGDSVDGTQEALARTYVRGRHYTERWNGAVFGPSLPGGTGWANQVADRRLSFRVPLFGATADTVGNSTVDSASTVVYRDGTKVCWENDVTCDIDGVAPTGRYRVETSATRSVADTSTTVSAVWEVNHDGTPALPVQVVRFSPRLDADNSAPGGRVFAVPVEVRRNPGAAAARVAALTVEASYDDGAHWTKVPVVDGKALLHHPAGGYVSLRAKATDTAGNTVEQTIIRAYRLR